MVLNVLYLLLLTEKTIKFYQKPKITNESEKEIPDLIPEEWVLIHLLQ